MLWDLIQQFQLGEARNQASSLEERVVYLERKVERNERVMVELIRYLEKREGRDLDGDGAVG
jgi:hypothetical protein